MRVADTEKELFDNKILHLVSDIISLSRDNTRLNERYVNLVRSKALAILTKCDDYLLSGRGEDNPVGCGDCKNYPCAYFAMGADARECGGYEKN